MGRPIVIDRVYTWDDAIEDVLTMQKALGDNKSRVRPEDIRQLQYLLNTSPEFKKWLGDPDPKTIRKYGLPVHYRLGHIQDKHQAALDKLHDAASKIQYKPRFKSQFGDESEDIHHMGFDDQFDARRSHQEYQDHIKKLNDGKIAPDDWNPLIEHLQGLHGEIERSGNPHPFWKFEPYLDNEDNAGSYEPYVGAWDGANRHWGNTSRGYVQNDSAELEEMNMPHVEHEKAKQEVLGKIRDEVDHVKDHMQRVKSPMIPESRMKQFHNDLVDTGVFDHGSAITHTKNMQINPNEFKKGMQKLRDLSFGLGNTRATVEQKAKLRGIFQDFSDDHDEYIGTPKLDDHLRNADRVSQVLGHYVSDSGNIDPDDVAHWRREFLQGDVNKQRQLTNLALSYMDSKMDRDNPPGKDQLEKHRMGLESEQIRLASIPEYFPDAGKVSSLKRNASLWGNRLSLVNAKRENIEALHHQALQRFTDKIAPLQVAMGDLETQHGEGIKSEDMRAGVSRAPFQEKVASDLDYLRNKHKPDFIDALNRADSSLPTGLTWNEHANSLEDLESHPRLGERINGEYYVSNILKHPQTGNHYALIRHNEGGDVQGLPPMYIRDMIDPNDLNGQQLYNVEVPRPSTPNDAREVIGRRLAQMDSTHAPHRDLKNYINRLKLMMHSHGGDGDHPVGDETEFSNAMNGLGSTINDLTRPGTNYKIDEEPLNDLHALRGIGNLYKSLSTAHRNVHLHGWHPDYANILSANAGRPVVGEYPENVHRDERYDTNEAKEFIKNHNYTDNDSDYAKKVNEYEDGWQQYHNTKNAHDKLMSTGSKAVHKAQDELLFHDIANGHLKWHSKIPQALYHGTPKGDVAQGKLFDIGDYEQGKGAGGDGLRLGPGVYTTSDHSVASKGYTKPGTSGANSTSTVIPHVYHMVSNLKNVFDAEDPFDKEKVRPIMKTIALNAGASPTFVDGDVEQRLGRMNHPRMKEWHDDMHHGYGYSKTDINKALEHHGYDGISQVDRYYPNVDQWRPRGGKEGHRVFIPFRRNSLKSLHSNQGTFNANEDNIYKARPVVVLDTLGKQKLVKPIEFEQPKYNSRSIKRPRKVLINKPTFNPYRYQPISTTPSRPGFRRSAPLPEPMGSTRSVPLAIPKTSNIGGDPRQVATQNPHSTAITTVGKPGSVFSKILGDGYKGETMHHISSTQSENGNHNHLVHSMNPEQASRDFLAHIAPDNESRYAIRGINKLGDSGSHQVSFVHPSGESHTVTFFRGRTATPEGNRIVMKGNDPIKSNLTSILGSEYWRAYWNPKEAHLWIDLEDSWDHGHADAKLEARLKALSGVKQVTLENESAPDQEDGFEPL